MAFFFKHPKCQDKREGCAACKEGGCIALHDTDFGGKPCPFYMSEATSRKKQNECYERLVKLGRVLSRGA